MHCLEAAKNMMLWKLAGEVTSINITSQGVIAVVRVTEACILKSPELLFVCCNFLTSEFLR